MLARPEIALWLQTEFGYRVTRPLSFRQGSLGVRWASLLWAERWSPAVKRLVVCASVVLGVGIVLENGFADRARSNGFEPNALLALSLTLYAAAYLWKRRTFECAMLASTNRNRPLDGSDIRKLRDSMVRAMEQQPAQRRPVRLFVATGQMGFTEEATSLAQSLGIVCYRRGDDEFEQCANGP